MTQAKYLLLTGSVLLAACAAQPDPRPEKQIDIPRIEQMPDAPQNYLLPDWAAMTRDLDAYVFDFNATGDFRPFIWIDDSRLNLPIESFGLYTAVGDRRQGPAKNNGEHHEAICVLGALNGATLAGIDKSNQNGYDFVRMAQNYFNSATNWNIVLNNTGPVAGALGGGYTRDFWYDVFPNMLFYSIGARYPEVEGVDPIMRSIAEQFCRADSVILATKGDFHMREFDFGNMRVGNTEQMVQPDAAAGFAYVLYGAYKKYGDERYLQAARSAMESLNAETESPFYEVIMPFAVYMAARMNAEQGTTYDVTKFMNWTFDGDSKSRPGWGVLTGEFDGYEVNGLCGSTSENYGFAMNTFDLAWALVPAVRYDQAYARAIGKWMVNAAANSRFYYPQYVAPEHQALDRDRALEISKGLIAYEGFRSQDKYGEKRLEGVRGVAIGDGPGWVAGNPPESMLSLYGSMHVGIFGAIIAPTNVEKILRLDCTAADLLPGPCYPTYLYYNPCQEEARVAVTVDKALPGDRFDLYDIVSRRLLAKQAASGDTITLPADSAAVIVILPAGCEIVHRNGRTLANGIVIDYKG